MSFLKFNIMYLLMHVDGYHPDSIEYPYLFSSVEDLKKYFKSKSEYDNKTLTDNQDNCLFTGKEIWYPDYTILKIERHV